MDFRSPDPLAVAVAGAVVPGFIPDHSLLCSLQSVDRVCLTDNQTVISVRSVFSVCRIGTGKVIFPALCIVGHERVRSLLDQRFFRIGIGDRALYSTFYCIVA